ncbi:unnamed protein product [Closterium sp. NIES-65]|nr:unnamed protein product [Closterium sp. NIES-65]
MGFVNGLRWVGGAMESLSIWLATISPMSPVFLGHLVQPPTFLLGSFPPGPSPLTHLPPNNSRLSFPTSPEPHPSPHFALPLHSLASSPSSCILFPDGTCSSVTELEEDGTCSSTTVSTVFDWGLAGLLQDLPPRDDAAQSLLDILDPEDDEWIDVSLAVAARMALPTGNWWPVQGGGGVAGFVAKLLSLIEECGEPTPQQQSRAVKVALRLWSWAMPKREQLQEQCETEEELMEVWQRSASAIWRSVACGGMLLVLAAG